jgi:hypothetical protein
MINTDSAELAFGLVVPSRVQATLLSLALE